MRFDPKCQRCPRLSEFLGQSRQRYPAYHSAPVAPFGDSNPRLLIVGLAPGLHGANRTGRPFTGDYAGVLLYETLHAYGWASAAVSDSPDDGLQLPGCRITNAVKCVPPQNKPVTDEIRRCNAYLAAELDELTAGAVVLALGTIAHAAVLRAFGLKIGSHRFAHGSEHPLPGDRLLIDSYHCSRYNTQTRRLTPQMFHDVVGRATRVARKAQPG